MVWAKVVALAALVLVFVGCPSSPTEVTGRVDLLDVSHAALATGSLRFVNGTYGPKCTGRSGGFSVALGPAAKPMDYPELSVLRGDVTCTLTLTSVVGDETFSALPAIELKGAFAVTGTAFVASKGTTSNVAFYANSRITPSTFTSDFVIDLLVSDDPKATSAGKAAGSYAGPSSSKSSITVSRTSQVADGVSSIVASVAIKNFAGKALPGLSVNLVHSGRALVSPANVLTDASGVATFTLTSSVGTLGDLTATVTGVTVSERPTVAFSPIPTKLAFVGSSTSTTISCAPLSIRTVDNADSNANSIGNTRVTLAADAGTFYSSSTCATAITGAQISAGTNSVTVYYRSSTAGTRTLTATSTGLSGATLTTVVSEAPPDRLTFTGATSATTVECTAYVVTARDATNVARAVSRDTALTFSDGNAGGTFSLSSRCADAVTTGTIPSGQSTTTVYYKKTSPGPTNLQVDAASFAPGQLSVTITIGPGATLSISANATTSTAVDCLPYVTTMSDAYGNVANAPSDLAVGLGGAGTNGAFYSNATCTAAITSVTLASGTPSASYYFKKTLPGTTTLLATRSGKTTGQRDVTVVTGPPAQLAYTVYSSPISPSSCRGYTVQLRDGSGNAVSSPSNLDIAPADGQSGPFYSNSTCTTAVPNTFAIPSGQNSASFYYKQATSGTYTLTLTSSYPSLSRSLVVSTGVPQKLNLGVAPSPIVQNVCTAYRIDRLDEQNLGAVSSSAVNVSVSGNASDSSVYTDAACSTSPAALVIPASQTSLTFYFRKTTPGTVTLSFATVGSPSLTSTSKTIVVSSGTASVLVFSAGATSIRRSTCSAYTIETRDEAGVVRTVPANATVTLSDGESGNFYADAACTTAASSLVLAAGTSNKTFYYSRLATGTVTLTAASSGMTPGARAVAVTTGLPAKVKVSSGATSLGVNTCNPYGLSLYDAADSLVAATANTSVSVSSSMPSVELYSDEYCTAVATSILIPTGSTKELVFAKATTPGQSGTFTVAASGLTGSTYAVTTTP
jgi:hypothetical protein